MTKYNEYKLDSGRLSQLLHTIESDNVQADLIYLSPTRRIRMVRKDGIAQVWVEYYIHGAWHCTTPDGSPKDL